jgi:hypothetical protein
MMRKSFTRLLHGRLAPHPHDNTTDSLQRPRMNKAGRGVAFGTHDRTKLRPIKYMYGDCLAARLRL